MTETAWLLALLSATALALGGVTAAIAVWRNQPARRLRRGLRVILRGDVQEFLMDPKGRRGLGLNFRSNQVAVARDRGQWGFLYGLGELSGAQVIVDGQVAGYAYRRDLRQPGDLVARAARSVTLRLLFDDPPSPDFVVDLWRAAEPSRRENRPPQAAIEEAAHWIARIEALLNRPQHSWWETPPGEARRVTADEEPERRSVFALRRFAERVFAGPMRHEDAA
jgi:hypothetical protein